MTIKFCSECNNLMNPKVENGLLLYVCARCEISIEPDSPIVSTYNLKKKHIPNSSKVQDLIHDVTLPRLNLACPKCEHKECIGYMEKNDEKALDFYYVCSKCFYEWSD